MKKALIIATVGGFIASFELNDIKILQELGYEVHGASNFEEIPIKEQKKKIKDSGLICHQISFSRQPFHKENKTAYKQLKEVMKKEHFDLIHCHTPVGGILGRLCARKYRKTGTEVLYTAHGFHFYKGAPLKNWLIYYPIEKIYSYWTDVLITINKEDYALAMKKMKAKQIEYVPGIGIDLEKFGESHVDKSEKRKELGIPEDAKLLLSVGELNENKNHEIAIRAIAKRKDIYYVIAGIGPLREHLEAVITECGLIGSVKLLGFRKDIGELCEAADAFVFPSFREGLSVSVMEAMASGLPVVCSGIRGNTDLVDESGGVMFNPHNVDECRQAISKLLASDMKKMGAYNVDKIKKFSLETVREQMSEIVGGGIITSETYQSGSKNVGN